MRWQEHKKAQRIFEGRDKLSERVTRPVVEQSLQNLIGMGLVG